MPSPSMTKDRTSSVKFFGVELCPDNVAVAMVFCSRCRRPCKACCQLLTCHFKDDLHLDLVEDSSYYNFVKSSIAKDCMSRKVQRQKLCEMLVLEVEWLRGISRNVMIVS